jgi:uncharacterized protein (DUF362 family)/Pyruvate/2-oxoacid:ferredoxin oxidoreductase delta subunit
MPPVVALGTCASYDDGALDEVLDRVLGLTPAWATLFQGDPVVLLKPNMLVPRGVDTAITTHPRFIAAAARAVRKVHSGTLLLGDSPAMGTTRAVARRIGLQPLLSGLDVELVNFTEPVAVSGGGGFGPLNLARPLVEADRIINLPKIKTHGQMGLTLATKNLYGAVVGMEKARLHLHAGRSYDTFGRLLNEIADRARCSFSLADGVIGVQGNGPSAGDPRALGLVAASDDMTALDRVFAEILGFDLAGLPMLRQRREAGQASAFLQNIEVAGEAIEPHRVTDWIPARPMLAEKIYLGPLARPLRHHLTTRPRFDDPLCTRCEICTRHCAAEAMVMAPRGRRHGGPDASSTAVAVDLDRCIRCYCCQEVCPEGAISVGEGALLRLARLARRR